MWPNNFTYDGRRGFVVTGCEKFGLATAQADTIRCKLLKIGAVIRVTVRKVWVALSESYPWQELFATVYARLIAWRVAARPSPA